MSEGAAMGTGDGGNVGAESAPVAWPVAELDPVRRLRALASALPGAVVVERVIPVPLAELWAIVSDLERAVPASEWHVRSLRITRRDGDRLAAEVRGVLGLRDRFAIVLRPGWCWMQGRLLVAGMAATPVPGGTRCAWATGLRLPGARALRPLLRRSLARSLHRLDARLTGRARTGDGQA